MRRKNNMDYGRMLAENRKHRPIGHLLYYECNPNKSLHLRHSLSLYGNRIVSSSMINRWISDKARA